MILCGHKIERGEKKYIKIHVNEEYALDVILYCATKVLTFVASVCSTITSEPLLLLTVGFLFIGGVIGIFGRLLSRG